MELVGTGVYPLRHAARLVGAPPAAIRRWVVGYVRRGRHYPPLWKTQLLDAGFAEPVIGFRDLLELRLVAAFEKHGVGLTVIRATADLAREEFGIGYPLTAKRFLTDGKSIFLDAIRSTGESSMIDMPKRQMVFGEVIRPSLYAGIEYDGVRARRWYPLGDDKRGVVLDPGVQFGVPIVTNAGIPTDVVHASFLAEGGDRRKVARIFSISPKEVDAAVRFEHKLAA